MEAVPQFTHAAAVDHGEAEVRNKVAASPLFSGHCELTPDGAAGKDWTSDPHIFGTWNWTPLPQTSWKISRPSGVKRYRYNMRQRWALSR